MGSVKWDTGSLISGAWSRVGVTVCALLQQQPHCLTDKQTSVFTHGSDCLVIGRVEPDADGCLTQGLVTVLNGELMGLQVLSGAHL